MKDIVVSVRLMKEDGSGTVELSGQEMNLLVERLHQQTTIVTSLLDSMLEVSQRKGGRK